MVIQSWNGISILLSWLLSVLELTFLQVSCALIFCLYFASFQWNFDDNNSIARLFQVWGFYLRIDAAFEQRLEMNGLSLSFSYQKKQGVRIFLLLFYLCQRTLFYRESEILKCAQKDSSNKQEETYISVILLFPAVEFPIKILSSHK